MLAVKNEDVNINVVRERESFENLGSNNITVKIYPNPASQNLTLDILTNQEGLSNIKVFDNTGQLIIEDSLLLLSGTNQHHLSCGEWNSGTYFITTTHQGVTVSRKVIVTN